MGLSKGEKNTIHKGDKYLIPEEAYKRLYGEYKKHGSLVIGVDFDGTIHDYHKEGYEYNNCKELLRSLKDIGCKIICWTAYKDHDYVEEYFKKNDLPLDGINCDGVELPYSTRKPFFNALLDDRAGIRDVYGDLSRLVNDIKYEKENKDTKILNKVSGDFEEIEGKVNILIGVYDPNGSNNELYDMVYSKFNDRVELEKREFKYANIGLKALGREDIDQLLDLNNDAPDRFYLILKDSEINMDTIILNSRVDMIFYLDSGEVDEKLANTINVSMVDNDNDLFDEMIYEIRYYLF